MSKLSLLSKFYDLNIKLILKTFSSILIIRMLRYLFILLNVPLFYEYLIIGFILYLNNIFVNIFFNYIAKIYGFDSNITIGQLLRL
jgi:hypothetical protein